MRSLVASVSFSLLAAACGSSGGKTIDAHPGGVDSGGTIDSATNSDGGIPPGALQLKYPDVDVPGGIEKTQCVVVNLHNANMLRIHEVHNQLSQLSHHLIVYTTTDTTEQPVPFDCQPFTDTLDPTKGAPIMITQKKDDDLVLPSGVAFTFAPNQMIRLEMHYINTTDTDATANATVNFVPMDEAAFQNEAGFLFIGDPDINIMAHSTFTLGPVFFPIPPEYAGVNFFDITGHEHHLGTNVVIQTGPGSGGPFTDVYNLPAFNWASPDTVQFNPPFQIPAGGGFNFTCSWDNTAGGTSVTFGESANNEMCFFWTYYYPNQGAKVCFHSTKPGVPIDACCPGSALCMFI
jgi:hypothetical protein